MHIYAVISVHINKELVLLFFGDFTLPPAVTTPSTLPFLPPILHLSQTQSSGPDAGAGAPEVAAADASCFQACGLRHT